MARMKKAAVKEALANGTHLAVGYSDSAKRAIVLAVDQRRQVYSGTRSDFSGHGANDGIKVQYLTEDDLPQGDPVVVGPHRVLDTWANYSTTVAAHRTAAAARATKLASDKERAHNAAARIPGAQAQIIYASNGWTVVGWRVALDIEQAERLADAITAGDA